jgi:hypothetical protein
LPMTIGIISNYYGTDPDLVSFVSSAIRNNSKMEVASHGYNHGKYFISILNFIRGLHH